MQTIQRVGNGIIFVEIIFFPGVPLILIWATPENRQFYLIIVSSLKITEWNFAQIYQMG